MEVCILTTAFPRFRGDHFGTFVQSMARALVAAGAGVRVVAPHHPGAPRRERVDGVDVARFRYALWPRLAYGDGIPTNLARRRRLLLQVPGFLLAYWWAALVRARRCQVLHGQWTISGLVACWAARWWRRPVVLTVRGSDVHVLGRGLLGRLNAATYRGVDGIVAVSEEIAARLRRAGVETGKIHVIHNGVGEEFHPGDRLEARRQLQLAAQGTIGLFVGMLVPVKGVDVLLEAMRAVDPVVRIVIVGDGERKQNLEARSRQLGLGPRIHFAGRQPHGRIPVWMRAADFLVLPSHSEGRPNVVLEAQACRLPVIATRVGGTPELVTDDVGILVDAGDAAGLSTALTRLGLDQGLRQRMGTAAGRRIRDGGHTWAAHAERTLALYEDVLRAVSRRATTALPGDMAGVDGAG